jgi:hypothetical protein
VEMLNALNALSENQSLCKVTPLSNYFVILAIVISLVLHLIILYIPIFNDIFHVQALNYQEWNAVCWFSLPVIALDEALKYYTRHYTNKKQQNKTNLFKRLKAIRLDRFQDITQHIGYTKVPMQNNTQQTTRNNNMMQLDTRQSTQHRQQQQHSRNVHE